MPDHSANYGIAREMIRAKLLSDEPVYDEEYVQLYLLAKHDSPEVFG